jgi:uncharacterized phage protein gp47/JayE
LPYPTLNDLFRIARDEVLLRNSNLTRDIVERAGSDANAIVASGAVVADAVTGDLIRLQAALYLDTARGSDLDRLVFDRYQLVRKGASPSVGQVEFTSPGPAGAGFDIPAGTQLRTTDGRTFATTASVAYPLGSSGPVVVPVQSQQAGLGEQARIGTITSIGGQISGAVSGLAATNSLATAGADDEETDESLRDRAKRFYRTSVRGTLAAIEAGALAVPGIRVATAFEVVNPDGAAARFVEVVVADAFAEQLVDTLVTPPAYQAQSDALVLRVLAGLQDVRAAGVQVAVTVGVVDVLGVALSLRFRGGSDPVRAALGGRSAIVAYTNSLQPGQTWVPADAEAVLATVPGLLVLGGEVTSPAGPVVPRNLEVIRTYLGAVTVGTLTS